MKNIIMPILFLISLLLTSCINTNEPNFEILSEPNIYGYINISYAEAMLTTQDTITINLVSYLNPIKSNLPRYNCNLNKLMLSKKLKKIDANNYVPNSGTYEVWFNEIISDAIQDDLEEMPNPIILLVQNVKTYWIEYPTNGGSFLGIHFEAESESDVEFYHVQD